MAGIDNNQAEQHIFIHTLFHYKKTLLLTPSFNQLIFFHKNNNPNSFLLFLIAPINGQIGGIETKQARHRLHNDECKYATLKIIKNYSVELLPKLRNR